jgi:hypothetical protein
MSHCLCPGRQMKQYGALWNGNDRKDSSTRTETCTSTTLSISNRILNSVVSKQGLQGQKMAINHVTYGTTSPWCPHNVHIPGLLSFHISYVNMATRVSSLHSTAWRDQKQQTWKWGRCQKKKKTNKAGEQETITEMLKLHFKSVYMICFKHVS